MSRAILVALGTGVAITAAAISTGAGANFQQTLLTRAEYDSVLREIDLSRAEVNVLCERLRDSYERDYCRAEASGHEMVRVAEVEEGYRRTREATRAAQRARIDARYQLERARCGKATGFKRDHCLVKAHAARGRAMLDAATPYGLRF